MKHQDIIGQMTLEEKAAFLCGKGEWQTRDIKRLGIPSIWCSDGPHGLRKQMGAGDHLGLNESQPATCFPTAATVANSWDEALAEEIGQALGQEAASQDVQILLGPGLNVKRSPLCGRNFEYFSEDPYLSGKMAAAYIRGIQGEGVYACPKHFAVNSQELRRMAMNAVVDERTLREIYLTGFEIAVKEGHAHAIMSSYNEVNGEYANQNPHLLQDILREEWGFDGIVITDWGASDDHAKGVAAGSDLEMPAAGLDSARELIRAVEDGRLRVEALDACVDRLLDAVLTLDAQKTHKTYDENKHHALARKAATESAVLLKNKENILPLPPKTKVALIGDFAFEPRYQGAGSSMVRALHVESMVQAIEAYDLEVVGSSRGYRRTGDTDAALVKEALDLAAQAEVVLYCFGLDELSETEGLDRTHMRIPQNQLELLELLMKTNENIVGILSAGSAVELPWQNSCKALLHGYLCGEAGASAMLDLITGKENPSGRLNETYPIRYEDTPAYRYFPATERNSEYREALYVGYRYYDTSTVRVAYPFGFGLSYTEFAYSDLRITPQGVSFVIKNVGARDGAEVAQLYVGLPNAVVFRPCKELKGFRRVFLRAGEQQTVTIPFDDKTFRYWNVETNHWEIEMGNYEIQIGASVRDIRLDGTLYVEGTTDCYPYHPATLPYYYTGLIQTVSDAEFTQLYGAPVPSGKWAGELGANDAICQMFYAKSALARFVYRCLTSKKKKSEESGKPDLNILFIYNMPFRALAKMTHGAVSMEMVEGILRAVNGHFFSGAGKVIGGYFRNRRANKEYEARL